MTRDLGHAPVRAVLFDYGLTLATFRRPDQALESAYQAIAQVLRGRRDGGDLDAAELLTRVHDAVESQITHREADGELREVDHVALTLTALHDCGITAADRALADRVLEIEQRAWWEGATVAPAVLDVLRQLRELGLALGLCSNAPYRAASFRGQLAHVGVAPLLDAVTLSSEVGWRKPDSHIFTSALLALGTTAEQTVMVGDKRREDVSGAQLSGLRAIRVREYHDDLGEGDTADEVLNLLAELPKTLQPLVNL